MSMAPSDPGEGVLCKCLIIIIIIIIVIIIIIINYGQPSSCWTSIVLLATNKKRSSKKPEDPGYEIEFKFEKQQANENNGMKTDRYE